MSDRMDQETVLAMLRRHFGNISWELRAAEEFAEEAPVPPPEPEEHFALPAPALDEDVLAKEHPDLASLRSWFANCRSCGLCESRTRLVFGVGDPKADLVVLGEAPGAQEDKKGEPFVGPSGKMLDKMLVNVLGLERERVYITNAVKCHPENNRDPTRQEVEQCMQILRRQLQIVKPKVILTMGRIAFQALFPDESGIMRNRGQWRKWNGADVMSTFHPAFLLRKEKDGSNVEKRLVWEDLLAVKERLQ